MFIVSVSVWFKHRSTSIH